jgi:hypothetical protein
MTDKTTDPLKLAAEYEMAIAAEADAIRAEHGGDGLDAALFLKLAPLLRRPIPAGFITTTPPVKGKPYESTGLRSVQVCIDRMDNVLSALAWTIDDAYENDGKLCRATVTVHAADGEVLVRRASYGGMGAASSEGNLRKGSFTNAAKRAFAMVGVGHEVYLGAADGDPDTDVAAAEEQGQGNRPRASRQAPPPAQVTPAVPPENAIAELLASDPELRGLRTKADDGMKILGAQAGQRLRELRNAKSEGDLVALVNRIENSMEAGAGAESGS